MKKKIKPSRETKKLLAAKMAAATQKGNTCTAIVKAFAEQFHYDKRTIYAWARKEGWRSGKRLRKDAGKLRSTGERFEDSEEIKGTAAVYHHTKHINAKESRMPLERARQVFEILSGQSTNHLPGDHQLRHILRRLELSRRHARLPVPTNERKSDYANQLHSLDFSVSNFALDPEKGLIPMWKRDYNKNKPENEALFKKQQLRLMVITDHLSGAFYVEYYTNQRVIEIADFLYRAWSIKDNNKFVFHGLPDILFIDNDKALHSYAMQRLFKYLDIKVPKLEKYSPWTKGSVESHINVWQRWFESVFLLDQFKPKDIDEVNEWAFAYSLYFQMTKKHSRHGQPRFQKWNNRIGDHLRECPEWSVYKTLLYSESEPRTVREGKFSFKVQGAEFGPEYRVKGLPDGAKIDVYIHPFEYEKNGAVTIQYPSKTTNLDNVLRTDIQTLTVLPSTKDQDGFGLNALPVTEPRKAPKNKTQKAFEKIEKVELPEQAKGGHPFKIPIPKDTPAILPKVGKTIQVTSDLDIKDVEYTGHQVRKQLVKKLGRRLNREDITIFESLAKDKKSFTEKDIDDIYDLIQLGRKAAEGGSNA
jgi:hypothetical protein